jgi:hypothetical protein
MQTELTLEAAPPQALTSGGVGTAARVMGALTLLIGGGWWGLMWTYVLTHNGARGLDELLIPITAGLTLVVLIVPTALLVRKARSRSGESLRFSRFALTMVMSLMTMTVIYAFV